MDAVKGRRLRPPLSYKNSEGAAAEESARTPIRTRDLFQFSGLSFIFGWQQTSMSSSSMAEPRPVNSNNNPQQEAHYDHVEQINEEDESGVFESEEEHDLETVLREAGRVSDLPPSLASTVRFLFGSTTTGPAISFGIWLSAVRRRRRTMLSSERSVNFSSAKILFDTPCQEERGVKFKKVSIQSEPSHTSAEYTLWERLGKAVSLDIDSQEFSWDRLISLHHTEHTSSADQSEDEQNKPLEVTVNSGGVVFFALFEMNKGKSRYPREGVAVMKFSSSRMATQSERLGYEFAKHFGVRTPQARVVHNCSSEWQNIKNAVEKARNIAITEGDEMGEATCSELLEALELSRCLLLMGYVHGCPLIDTPWAFNSQEAAQKTASSLGRLLILDLVVRNEDRLPCKQLGWRGNPANLMLTDKVSAIIQEPLEGGRPETPPRRNRATSVCHKERRFFSVDSRFSPDKPPLISHRSDTGDWYGTVTDPNSEEDVTGLPCCSHDFHLVAIDSGVPRRPPAGKRYSDQLQYPKLVELLLNSIEFSSTLLYELSGERLGYPTPGEVEEKPSSNLSEDIDHARVVLEFRSGFRSALREMQSLHVFLLKLHQKLEILLKNFLNTMSRSVHSDSDEKEDSGAVENSPMPSSCWHSPLPDREILSYANGDGEEVSSHITSTPREFSRSALRSLRESSPDVASPCSRDNSQAKHARSSNDPLRSMRMTLKLKELTKNAKVDPELCKELELWNESLKNEAIKLCNENAFHTGFFEGSDFHTVVDSYELKVRLEHLLERMSLISQAAATERPSSVTNFLFIGGALAARSSNTLQYLGITNVLCLCPNELGQAETQHKDLFEYQNFRIYDTDDADISGLFEPALEYIDNVERTGGKILVHCFEGKSRSATVVLAYLMMRKNYTLSEAWTYLKKVHRRAQPNDGFMRTLMDLDKKLYGKTSMDWQQRKPAVRICPVCSKNVGISSSSLKLHLQKAHRRISSGSLDSIDVKELQQIMESIKIK